MEKLATRLAEAPETPARPPVDAARGAPALAVALLTAGRDRPYALGAGAALAGQGIAVDYIGSEAVDGPEVRNSPLVRILHFRNQQEDAGLGRKIFRIGLYYFRLV